MAREKHRWGYLRIRGELLSSAIWSPLPRSRPCSLVPAWPPRGIGPTWRQSLRAQAEGIFTTGLLRWGGQDLGRGLGAGAHPIEKDRLTFPDRLFFR